MNKLPLNIYSHSSGTLLAYKEKRNWRVSDVHNTSQKGWLLQKFIMQTLNSPTLKTTSIFGHLNDIWPFMDSSSTP